MLQTAHDTRLNIESSREGTPEPEFDAYGGQQDDSLLPLHQSRANPMSNLEVSDASNARRRGAGNSAGQYDTTEAVSTQDAYDDLRDAYPGESKEFKPERSARDSSNKWVRWLLRTSLHQRSRCKTRTGEAHTE